MRRDATLAGLCNGGAVDDARSTSAARCRMTIDATGDDGTRTGRRGDQFWLEDERALVVRDESRYSRGALPPITWTEESEDHIATHGVTPEQVQEALYTRPRWATPGRGGTTLVFAMTDAGRCLLVVIAPALDGGVYVVTARDLNDSERRTFRRKGR